MRGWLRALAVGALLGGTVAEGAQERLTSEKCALGLAAGSSSVTQHLDTARCYDTAWDFAAEVRVIAQAIDLLKAEIAASPAGTEAGAGPRFVGGDLAPPARTNAPVGNYPLGIAQKGIKGTVFVEAALDRNGRVRQARVVQSVPELEANAVRVVRESRFQRTEVEGVPVEVAFIVPVRFGLPRETTPADWIDLARVYYDQRHLPAALQTLNLALHYARLDSARFEGARAGRPEITAGEIQEPTKIRHVQPVYPSYAVEARLSGSVIIEALIDLTGKVGRARVQKSAPGFDAAAVDAVSQWEYTATRLDGQPISVMLIVIVNFNLK